MSTHQRAIPNMITGRILPVQWVLLAIVLSACSSSVFSSTPVSHTSTLLPNEGTQIPLSAEPPAAATPLPGLEVATLPGLVTVTPAACAPVGSKDRVDLLSVDPPAKTRLTVGQAYLFTARVKFQLMTWPRGYLQMLIYQHFGSGNVSIVNSTIVKVEQGCEIRELSVPINPLFDAGQDHMELIVLLRWDNAPGVEDRTLLTPYEFMASYPVSR